MVIGVKPRVLHTLGKCFTTELHLHLLVFYCCCSKLSQSERLKTTKIVLSHSFHRSEAQWLLCFELQKGTVQVLAGLCSLMNG
jgi:hypothetical protein